MQPSWRLLEPDRGLGWRQGARGPRGTPHMRGCRIAPLASPGAAWCLSRLSRRPRTGTEAPGDGCVAVGAEGRRGSPPPARPKLPMGPQGDAEAVLQGAGAQGRGAHTRVRQVSSVERPDRVTVQHGCVARTHITQKTGHVSLSPVMHGQPVSSAVWPVPSGRTASLPLRNVTRLEATVTARGQTPVSLGSALRTLLLSPSLRSAPCPLRFLILRGTGHVWQQTRVPGACGSRRGSHRAARRWRGDGEGGPARGQHGGGDRLRGRRDARAGSAGSPSPTGTAGPTLSCVGPGWLRRSLIRVRSEPPTGLRAACGSGAP